MPELQRFYEVYFDGLHDKSTDATSLVDSYLHRHAVPIYASLNGARGTKKGYLRKNNWRFGEYRGIVILLSASNRNLDVGRIVNHGQRGPFTGKFLYSNAQVPKEPLFEFGKDIEKTGQFITSVYEEGLSRVRGRFGVPHDFLEDFFRDFTRNKFTATLEHNCASFPQHKVHTRLWSKCSPINELHYISVRRYGSKIENSVHIGTIEKPHAFQMHHKPTFDGSNFSLVPWLKKPHWPVSFCRDTVSISEFLGS